MIKVIFLYLSSRFLEESDVFGKIAISVETWIFLNDPATKYESLLHWKGPQFYRPSNHKYKNQR
jgi:hypothetical protein